MPESRITRDSLCPLCGSGMTSFGTTHSDGEEWVEYGLSRQQCVSRSCELPVKLWADVAALKVAADESVKRVLVLEAHVFKMAEWLIIEKRIAEETLGELDEDPDEKEEPDYEFRSMFRTREDHRPGAQRWLARDDLRRGPSHRG